MARTFEATVEVTVTITVENEDVIDRAVNNHNDEGVPVPYGEGQGGWRDNLYNLTHADDVIEMLAYNYVVNDRVVQTLDGWADLTAEQAGVTYRQDRGTVEIDVREVTP